MTGMHSPFSYQPRMPLNGLFNSLRLDADIVLSGLCAAVLQEPLDKGNVAAVVLVDLRGVPLAIAVGADALIPKGLFLFRNEVFVTLEKVVDRLCDVICKLSTDTMQSIIGRKWIIELFN